MGKSQWMVFTKFDVGDGSRNSHWYICYNVDDENYPEPLWGFFFGLVMASAILIGRHTDKWDITKVIALITGCGTAIVISLVSPAGSFCRAGSPGAGRLRPGA